MPSVPLRRVLAFVLPEGPVLAAAAVLWAWETPRTALTGFLQVYPAIVLAAGVFLAWRFGRPRVLLALILLALSERVLGHVTPDAVEHAAIALFLPVDLVLLTLLPVRALRSAGTATAVGLVGVQAVLIVVLRDPSFAGTADLLRAPVVPAALTGWTRVPAPALLACVGAAGLLGARTALHPNAQGRGFFWATIATLLALDAASRGVTGAPALTYWLATAGLMLVVATVETSHALAFRDGLTGLPARRAFDEALARLRGPWTVAMVDVDRFKQVNDTHGHDVGDQVLRMVAATLQQVRGAGRAYRYGGEEFAILFPGRAADEVAPHLEILRLAVEETPFVLRAPDRPARKPDPKPARRSSKGRHLNVTVSIGYAEAGADERGTRAAEVVAEADAALYRAKRSGRNRVRGPGRG